jgi:hypothetical protein
MADFAQPIASGAVESLQDGRPRTFDATIVVARGARGSPLPLSVPGGAGQGLPRVPRRALSFPQPVELRD